MELLHFIVTLLPPHRVELTNSRPNCGWNIDIFVVYFADTVIVGIDVYDKMLVNWLSNVIDNFFWMDRLKRQLLSTQDLIDSIGDYFREVEVDESGWAHANWMVRVGLLELDLMVVQQFRRFIFTSDINNDISLLPYSRVSWPENLGIFELFGVFS